MFCLTQACIFYQVTFEWDDLTEMNLSKNKLSKSKKKIALIIQLWKIIFLVY